MSELDDSSPDIQVDSVRAQRQPWRELALFAEMCMELSWLALWYVFIVQSQRPVSYWQTLWVLGVILFSAYLFARTFQALNIGMRWRQLLIAAFLILCVIIGLKILLYPNETISLGEMLTRSFRNFRNLANLLPAEFIVMAFVLYVCWRGISRIDRRISSAEVLNGFKIGILMLLLYGLIARLDQYFNGYELYIFLFASLLALSAARISISGYLRGGQRIPFDRHWVLGVSFAILIMVVISAMVVYLIKGQFLDLIARVMSWIVLIIAVILSPLLFLALRAVIFVGQWLNISRVFQTLAQVLSQLQSFIGVLVSKIGSWLSSFSNNFLARFLVPVSWMKSFILWGSLVLIILALALMVRNRLIRNQAQEQGDYQPLPSQGNWLSLLREALRRNLKKMVDDLERVIRLREAQQALAAARIRRIYAHLMDLSEKLNKPRPASRTPLEFLPDLESLFPGLRGELTMITNAYLRVRYGDLPEAREDVESIELAWKQIAGVGKDMLKAMKAGK